MTKAVFQSGLSWRVIEAKWEGFREAFEGFDAAKVAGFTPADVDRLAQDARIVRNRRKIQATVDNAIEMVELDREHNGFRNDLREKRKRVTGGFAPFRPPPLDFEDPHQSCYTVGAHSTTATPSIGLMTDAVAGAA
jgi:3-methyladenine DNA glycosylase Tag